MALHFDSSRLRSFALRSACQTHCRLFTTHFSCQSAAVRTAVADAAAPPLNCCPL
jgi:hypothetical protein